MDIETFRTIVETAGPRQYSTKIKRNSALLAWVMEQSASLPGDTSIADRTTFILEGELLINLLEWCNRNDVTYSQGQKMATEGVLRSKKVGGRVKVPVDEKPTYQRIKCEVCNREIGFITGTHLKTHDMTMEDYRKLYPNAQTISDEASGKIVDWMTGREVSEETGRRISEAKTGVTPQNHPRYVVGSYAPSPETIEKMRVAHIGRTHSEETKAKMAEAHLGIPHDPERIARVREGLLKFYESHPGFFTGRKHTPETIAKMAERAIERELAYGPEERARIAELKSIRNRGLKRTPEQKETYRRARSKWMSENPLRVRNTAGERSIMAYLEQHGVEYKMQWLIPGESTANGHHPHDFFLPAYNTIIEFDGSHHWAFFWFNIKGKTDEQIAAMLERQVVKDAEENWAAGQAGYRIIRVRGYADVGDSEWGGLEEQLVLQGFVL